MISLGEIAEIKSIHPNSQLLSGDILLSTKGSIGPAKLVSSETTLEHSSRYCVIRLKSEQITPEYLYRCICSDDFQNNLKNQARGTAMQSVPTKDVAKLQILLVPVEQEHNT